MFKYLLYVYITFLSIQISAQSRKFYNSGTAELQKPVESLQLNYLNDLPFLEVIINDKKYNFLFDTGAPTVISSAIFKELGLKNAFESEVGDSQKSVRKQTFTMVPEISIGNVDFKNIGAVVIDFTEPEFKCLRMDGIIGSNQMALLFWKINYLENSMLVSKDLKLLNNSGSFLKIPFKASKQKLPVINSKIIKKNISIEIDTGFNGKLQINKGEFNVPQNVAKEQYLVTKGINSVSLYGPAPEKIEYIFKLNKLTLANQEFENQVLETGSLNLVGNQFLKNYEFILDWKTNTLHLKPIIQPETTLKSFGFSYRFINNKAVISLIFRDKNIPLEMNDEIVSINDISLDNLHTEDSCKYYLNTIEKELSKITIRIRRGNEIKVFDLEKISYF